MSNTTEKIKEGLLKHVYALADRIGERNIFHSETLNEAALYIENEWKLQGYSVVPYIYEARGVRCANLEVTREGSVRPEEIILVGAHYDSVYGSPGANDNASGVAMTLELSRLFADFEPDKTIRFVAFVNEEPPFFHTSKRGSRIYAKMARKRRDKIVGAVILETVGCYSDKPKSQQYPALLKHFYPDTANFVAFVSNIKSRHFLKEVTSNFKSGSNFPVESIAVFTPLAPGAAWSDHSSFWQAGYKALMVTDTAFYRYHYYHTAQDTADRINYESMARVTDGLYMAVRSLVC